MHDQVRIIALTQSLGTSQAQNSNMCGHASRSDMKQNHEDIMFHDGGGLATRSMPGPSAARRYLPSVEHECSEFVLSIQTGTSATAACAAKVRQRGRKSVGSRVSAGGGLCQNGNGQPSTLPVRLEELKLHS